MIPDRRVPGVVEPVRARTKAGALGALLFLSLLSYCAFAEEGLEERRAELEKIERQVGDLERDLGSERDRRDGLLNELATSERAIAELARDQREVAARLAEQAERLEEVVAREAAQRDALAGERAALGRLLRSAYASGPGAPIRLLLNQEDVGRMARISAYYGYLNRYRLERVERARAGAERLAVLVREVDAERRRLAELAERQALARAELDRAQAQRRGLLDLLDATIATKEDRITELAEDAAALRALLDHLERRARTLPEAEVDRVSITRLRGQLPWPVPKRQLLAHFGHDKEESGRRWDGVLIATAEGSEVRAVHDGRVVYADWLRGFGLVLIIEHDARYMSVYGHNQSLLKEPGEWVVAGEVVALSGNTGGLRSDALYFAIRHRGTPIDPELWCGG